MPDPMCTHRWQTGAHRTLGKLIREGHAAGLPPLMWTLATTGALTGTAPGLTPDEDPRAAITGWAAHLEGRVTETARADGRTSLYAPFSRDGERVGALRAEIWPELDPDED